MSVIQQPARIGFLLLLLAVIVGLFVDTRASLQHGPVSALRVQEPAAGDAGTVDAFCGFAPCGMPLECE